MNRRLLPIIVGLVACADEPTAPSGLSNADGAPAQIVYVVDAYAGGSRVLDSLVLDSVGGTWRRAVCGPISAVGMSCGPTTTQVDQGVVAPGIGGALFERARRADFRALRRDYLRVGVTPPDLTTHRLEIVQNEKRQTVTWQSGAEIPNVVSALVCRLEQARGWLGLCAD
jgi:hypothetical protein